MNLARLVLTGRVPQTAFWKEGLAGSCAGR